MANNAPKFHYRTQFIYDFHRWYISLRIIKFKQLSKNVHACDVPFSFAIGITRKAHEMNPYQFLILHLGFNKKNIRGFDPVGQTAYLKLPFQKHNAGEAFSK